MKIELMKFNQGVRFGRAIKSKELFLNAIWAHLSDSIKNKDATKKRFLYMTPKGYVQVSMEWIDGREARNHIQEEGESFPIDAT